MRINMKLEYNLGRYSLKVLNKSHSIDVLDFYYRNRRDFDKYESDKPASFYTENFISRMLEAERPAFYDICKILSDGQTRT